MIRPGDIAPRRDSDHELYVTLLPNDIHLPADTGRVITCPFIPGQIPDTTMAMIVATTKPDGVVLPELIQWLPRVALDEPIGNIGAAAIREVTATVTALVA